MTYLFIFCWIHLVFIGWKESASSCTVCGKRQTALSSARCSGACMWDLMIRYSCRFGQVFSFGVQLQEGRQVPGLHGVVHSQGLRVLFRQHVAPLYVLRCDVLLSRVPNECTHKQTNKQTQCDNRLSQVSLQDIKDYKTCIHYNCIEL